MDYYKFAKETARNASTKAQLDAALGKVSIKKGQMFYTQYVGILNEMKKNAKQARLAEKREAANAGGVGTPDAKPVADTDRKNKTLMRVKKWVVLVIAYGLTIAGGVYEVIKSASMSNEDNIKLNMMAAPWALTEILSTGVAGIILWGIMEILKVWQLNPTLNGFEWTLRIFSISVY